MPRYIWKPVLSLVIAVVVLGEIAWVVTGPSRKRASTQSATIGAKPGVAAVPVPDSTPTSVGADSPIVRLGVLTNSRIPIGVEVGFLRAIGSQSAGRKPKDPSVELVRCEVTPTQPLSSCPDVFRNKEVTAVLANPEVDPTEILTTLQSDQLPYIGVFPSADAESTAPNSIQFGPGTLGRERGPLQWAIQQHASSLVIVSTTMRRNTANQLVAEGKKAGFAVKSLDFDKVGTDLAKYLSPKAGSQPVVSFLTAPNGCDTIGKGLGRRRAELAGRIGATFVPAECAENVKREDLDGLRVMTTLASAYPGDQMEAIGESTLRTVYDILKFIPANSDFLLAEALANAESPRPRNGTGEWSCVDRPDAVLQSLCGRQVLIQGLSVDVSATRIWIDAL